MRVCGVCKEEGHNARTCHKKVEVIEPKIETVDPTNEKLEQIKRAVAIQNIGEEFLVKDLKDSVVPNTVLEDPSFWDHEQRKMIARELLKFRRAKKEVIVIKDAHQELLKDLPKETVVLPHVPGKLLDVKVEKDEYLEGIMAPLMEKEEECIESGER